ncbi:hypothetical protein QZH41_019105, partial [Actinostola sp. cb2023]
MSVPPSTNLKDTAFLDDLADKLARIYVTGKSKSARRKKRAVGSVAANIVNVTAASGSSNYADVTFYVVDSGKVANATFASATMNKLNKNEMTLITSPLA